MSETQTKPETTSLPDYVRRIYPALEKAMPKLYEASQVYHQAYPLDSTSADVLNAVTVAVPLRHFMLLVGLGLIATKEEMEKRKAANDGKEESKDA